MPVPNFRYCLNGSTIKTTPILKNVAVARTGLDKMRAIVEG